MFDCSYTYYVAPTVRCLILIVKPHLFPVMRLQHRALLARIAPHGQAVWQLAHSRPCHNLQPGHVVIHTTYVALNPFDWQGVAYRFGVGPEAKVMGRDGAGVVVKVGKGVTRFQKGDRVRTIGSDMVLPEVRLIFTRYGSARTPVMLIPAPSKSTLFTRPRMSHILHQTYAMRKRLRSAPD